MEGDEALTRCLWGLLRLDSPLQTVLSPRRTGEGVRSAQNYYIYIREHGNYRSQMYFYARGGPI